VTPQLESAVRPAGQSKPRNGFAIVASGNWTRHQRGLVNVTADDSTALGLHIQATGGCSARHGAPAWPRSSPTSPRMVSTSAAGEETFEQGFIRQRGGHLPRPSVEAVPSGRRGTYQRRQWPRSLQTLRMAPIMQAERFLTHVYVPLLWPVWAAGLLRPCAGYAPRALPSSSSDTP